MAKKIIWKGLSTRGYKDSGAFFQKNDIEIIKEGILNFIFTLKGERLYDPTYGTDIPLMTFEQLDDTTLAKINSEITRAFESDSRVDLLRCDVVSHVDTQSVIANCYVLYVDYGIESEFEISVLSDK
jgi:phage baseplate assembly protein W